LPSVAKGNATINAVARQSGEKIIAERIVNMIREIWSLPLSAIVRFSVHLL
jgi:hypothetical protein